MSQAKLSINPDFRTLTRSAWALSLQLLTPLKATALPFHCDILLCYTNRVLTLLFETGVEFTVQLKILKRLPLKY